MQKTGQIERTVDREFAEEEGRYKMMEKETNNLQKEAKAYLDSMRSMVSAQSRIAETVALFYSADQTSDSAMAGHSYKSAVDELDAGDAPFRATVLDPIGKLNSYYPNVNTAIVKRGHKMSDYDAARAKVRKLVEKPSDDTTKLPRAQSEHDEARDIFNILNDQLIAELPMFVELRIPYLNPSFEAMIRCQLNFATEGYEKLSGVQRYFSENIRDDYANGALDTQVEGVLEEMKELKRQPLPSLESLLCIIANSLGVHGSSLLLSSSSSSYGGLLALLGVLWLCVCREDEGRSKRAYSASAYHKGGEKMESWRWSGFLCLPLFFAVAFVSIVCFHDRKVPAVSPPTRHALTTPHTTSRMAAQGTNYDSNADIVARLGGLSLAEGQYASVQQQAQSPIGNVSGTPRLASYSAYANDQQGYSYYGASAGVDPAYGAQMPAPNYPYGGPVELMSPAVAALSFAHDGFGAGEVYGNGQDRSPQPSNGASGQGRQSYRAQGNASYFGYPDQRQYWMPQGVYVQGNERKRESHVATRGPSSTHSAAYRQEFANSLLPHYATQVAFSQAGQYGLHPAQGFGHLTPFPGSFAPGYRPNRRVYDDSGVARSALLEDFRLNKLKKWELGHGSRFIQQKLETASPEDSQKLFEEIYPNAYQLMTDVFGNYVIQKMFEHGDQMQKAALAKKMQGHVLQLSMQMYGCRVVQKALEHVLSDQRAKLVAELEPHILECVRSSNANHVIQRLINLGPPQSVPDAFIGHVEELAKHPYGCRVLQKTFENLDEDMKRGLLDEMHACVISLTEDQFGIARHKFASNVIEKAIIHADSADRRVLIDELIGVQPDGSNQIGMLLRDAYGNFALQTGIFSADPKQQKELLDLVLPLIPPLRHTPVGKRLEGRLSQLESEGGVSGVQMRKSLSSSTATTDNTLMSRTASSSTVPTSPEMSQGVTPTGITTPMEKDLYQY
ncbi:hypothetical protein L204_101727 [Cryptococcus depauperatus]